MSKILEATCSASGMVSAEGVTVPAAEVMSEGTQASEGLLFMEGDVSKYLPSSASDVKTTIEKTIQVLTDLNAALTEIASCLTAIGTGMTGPTTAPPGSLPTSVITITSKVTALNATKAQLNTLKGALK